MTRAKLALLLAVVLFVPGEAAPCSVMIGGELLYPSPGETLGLRSALVFAGGFSTIDALTLTDAEGSEVPIEVDQYSGLYGRIGLAVVWPTVELNADSEYMLAGTVSLGESADVEFHITTADEPAPIGEIAPDTVDVETWFTPNAESLSSCLSADGSMIAVAISGPSQPVARVVLISTSLGHRALFVGAGDSMPHEVIFLRATDAAEPVFVEILDVNGGRLAPFELPPTETCFDGPAAAEAPTSRPPDTGLVYPDAVASVARPCADFALGDEAGCSQRPGRAPAGAALCMLLAVAMRRRRIGRGRPLAGRA